MTDSPNLDLVRSIYADFRHPVISRLYVGQAKKADTLGMADRRRQLLASLSGRVIEVGAGLGTNFAYYPPDVEEVVAVEPEPYLRNLAERAAGDASRVLG